MRVLQKYEALSATCLLLLMLLWNSFIATSAESIRSEKVLAEVTSNDTISFRVFGAIKHKTIRVRGIIDLCNATCYLPEGYTLDLRQGEIFNGYLVGNNTKLKIKDGSFNNVRISGSWNIPTVRSSFFKDLSYTNSLKDLIALTNPKIQNTVYISDGHYFVSTNKEGASCIVFNDNTQIVLNGVVEMKPNGFNGCNVIELNGCNIQLSGNGSIIGDKEAHQGNTGEWGMGVSILNAKKVRLSGVTIKDCWGDCVYVAGKSDDIIIQKCVLDNARRQGISITSASNVIIKQVQITNIGGTAPEFGIDVEPDRGEYCQNIIIEQVSISDCQGGIFSWGGAPGAFVEGVSVKACYMSGIAKEPFRFDKCANVSVRDCTFVGEKKRKLFTILFVTDFKENNNKTISYE